MIVVTNAKSTSAKYMRPDIMTSSLVKSGYEYGGKGTPAFYSPLLKSLS